MGGDWDEIKVLVVSSVAWDFRGHRIEAAYFLKSPSFPPMWFVFWSRMEPCVCSCLLGMFNVVLKSCSTSLSSTSKRSNKRPAIIYLVGCLPCLRPLSCTPGAPDAWLRCVSDLSLFIFPCSFQPMSAGTLPFPYSNLLWSWSFATQNAVPYLHWLLTNYHSSVQSVTYTPFLCIAQCVNSKPAIEMKTAWRLV